MGCAHRLPHLVQLLKRQNGPKQYADALNGLFSASPCPLPPADFLIALHSLKDDPRQTANAIGVCLKDLGRIFNFTVLAKVLTKLVESTPMPQLLMVTFITAMRDCPKLTQQSGPAVQVLKRCVDKKIWTTPLWKGFLRSIKDYSHLDPHGATMFSVPCAQFWVDCVVCSVQDGCDPEVFAAEAAGARTQGRWRGAARRLLCPHCEVRPHRTALSRRLGQDPPSVRRRQTCFAEGAPRRDFLVLTMAMTVVFCQGPGAAAASKATEAAQPAAAKYAAPPFPRTVGSLLAPAAVASLSDT